MKRSIFLVMAALCLFWQLHAQIPTTGLVAHYTFSGNTLDQSGNAFHGVTGSTMFVKDRFDINSEALYLDGVSDSLILPVAGFTPMEGDFTISMWIKTNDQSGQNFLAVEDYNEDTLDNFHLKFFANHQLNTNIEVSYASYMYWNGSGAAGNHLIEGHPGRVQDGFWKHVVLKREAGVLELWFDRILHGSGFSIDTMGAALPFIVGAGPQRFHGIVDDFAFYDRAVSEKEIMNLFHDRQVIVITSPKETDAYIQGDSAIIAWYADTTIVGDSVDVEFSTDGGMTWTLTDQNQLVDWTPYKFALPFPIHSQIKVRVMDHHTPNHQATSGAFVMSEYAWENVSPSLPFTYRDGSGLIAMRDTMWLLGGWDPPYDSLTNHTMNEIWYSIDDGVNWHFLKHAQWYGRHVSGWLVHDNKAWVIGGDPQSGCRGDVWVSEDMRNWDMLHDTIPVLNGLRCLSTVTSFGGKMFYMGGSPNYYGHVALNDVYSSPDGLTWTREADAPWRGRGSILGQCVDPSGKMWLLGGGHAWNRTSIKDVWNTTDGITWNPINDNAPWKARFWHNVGWWDGKMWIFGGMQDSQLEGNDAWYSSDGENWHELKNAPLKVRHAASSEVFNNAWYIMCGIASNDVWRIVNTTNPPMKVARQNAKDQPMDNVLYPNPSTGIITSTLRFESATVLDLQGKAVSIIGAGSTIDLSVLPAGTYTVYIRLPGHRMNVQKVVRQ